MLHPIHTFIHRIGRLVLLDRAADPAANGEIQRNATHVKVYSGGAVRSLSDIGVTAAHAANHQPAGSDPMSVDAAAATGSLRTLGTTALKAAAGDHTHAGGGPAQATQAALEAETNEDTYAAPDLIKFSPGVAKAYVNFSPPDTTIDRGYNMSSVTDIAVGQWRLNFTVAFSDALYSATFGGRPAADGAGTTLQEQGDGVPVRSTTQLLIRALSSAGADSDWPIVSATLFGDQ